MTRKPFLRKDAEERTHAQAFGCPPRGDAPPLRPHAGPGVESTCALLWCVPASGFFDLIFHSVSSLVYLILVFIQKIGGSENIVSPRRGDTGAFATCPAKGGAHFWVTFSEMRQPPGRVRTQQARLFCVPVTPMCTCRAQAPELHNCLFWLNAEQSGWKMLASQGADLGVTDSRPRGQCLYCGCTTMTYDGNCHDSGGARPTSSWHVRILDRGLGMGP